MAVSNAEEDFIGYNVTILCYCKHFEKYRPLIK